MSEITLKETILKIMKEHVDKNNGIILGDQTTPNMIQRISGIFERKPLISIGI